MALEYKTLNDLNPTPIFLTHTHKLLWSHLLSSFPSFTFLQPLWYYFHSYQEHSHLGSYSEVIFSLLIRNPILRTETTNISFTPHLARMWISRTTRPLTLRTVCLSSVRKTSLYILSLRTLWHWSRRTGSTWRRQDSSIPLQIRMRISACRLHMS